MKKTIAMSLLVGLISASVYAEDNSGVTAGGSVDKDCEVVVDQLTRSGQGKSAATEQPVDGQPAPVQQEGR